MAKRNDALFRKVVYKRKLKFTIAFSTILILLHVSLAYGAFFDTAGQSARPMGMGEVFIASTGTASSYWYNPAGLATLEGKQLSISNGIINPAVSSDLMKYQISYAGPMGENSGLGIGISGLGTDGASEMVISGAYGVRLGENLGLGGNVKIMRWAIEGQPIAFGTKTGTDEDLSVLSFSLDLSATYTLGELFGLADFATGVYVRDAIMPNISESGEGDDGKLPIEIGLGIMGQRDAVIAECDLAFVNGETILRGGVEYGITGSNLKVRGGMIYGSDFEDDIERTDFDFGLGYSFRSLIFDYAYNLPIAIDETGGRHFISFGFSF
ncbi:MAG: hypothetical protein HOC71_07510 [Candidatus Latescibacteria bacterium]|jgi:hypothetical protein|nr:hypothetical protein [Candidatus Latescibacterota bacterium]